MVLGILLRDKTDPFLCKFFEQGAGDQHEMHFVADRFKQEHGWSSTRAWMQEGVRWLDSACTDSSRAA